MSLTIDGKSLNQLGLALLPGFQHPAAPPIRDYTVSIPGRPGAYYFGSDIDPLEFNLPLIIKPQEDRFLLAAAIRKMVAAFIDPYGKPKEVKLIYDYEPDKYYLVRYSGSMPIDRYFRMGKFELPLIAYDPHAYSVLQSTDEIRWMDMIPWMSDIPIGHKGTSYTINSPQDLDIDNFGSKVIRPVIEISGNADNLSFTVKGERFSFGSFRNSSFLIDAERYTVLKDSKNFLFQLQGNLEKLELMPGANAISIGGSNLNINIAIKYRAKY
ncbi:phage tail domain-containing protein [Bacillus thuringiensis]|uniref:phage tail domain-containing protein n=1 Tax=Bacillus thuringiensis TaxID=1428 RepID=UPI000A38FB7E|nr:phage tail family protein [Bacillus thuringiensis]MEC2708153.1 phage tail family protein [Bacillus thuringiensis]OUB76474.1 phage tail protein [Bacillus thuringiensis serovar dakota]PDZ92563.1 phage tail family protein [Bacillus thuringiensis]